MSPGVIKNNTTAVYGNTGELNMKTLQTDGSSVTATATELNLLQNASGGSVVNGKAVMYGTNGDIAANQIKLGNTIITLADELNILDGVTASKDELNLVDGATSASVSSNKAVVQILNINGVRNITLSGNVIFLEILQWDLYCRIRYKCYSK